MKLNKIQRRETKDLNKRPTGLYPLLHLIYPVILVSISRKQFRFQHYIQSTNIYSHMCSCVWLSQVRVLLSSLGFPDICMALKKNSFNSVFDIFILGIPDSRSLKTVTLGDLVRLVELYTVTDCIYMCKCHNNLTI